MSNKPIARKDNLVIQELEGEILIYDLNNNKAFCLNETSNLVWQLCDGNKSVSQIAEAVSKKMNQKTNEDLVWLALDQLKKENLLSNSEGIVSYFDGMSRREVIRKVGLGTMIALPIVTGLIAPTAAMAQSPGVCGGACECPNATGAGGSCAGGCNIALPGCACRNLGAPSSGTPGNRLGTCTT